VDVYDEEETEFILAMKQYQSINKRKFPTFTEVLAVVKSLGWLQVAMPTALPTWEEIQKKHR
jgi:hypothetical protein